MKGIFVFFLSLLIIEANAQGINFQGVARSANGTILASSNISLRLSVLSKSVDATPEYVETKKVVTNAQGIFSIVIGDGVTATVGTFTSINWANAPKFLKVEMDPSGGTSYINMGITQLQYVPYSFYSLGVAADNVTGVLSVAKGGTGVASLADLKTALKITSIDTTSLSNRINNIVANASNFTRDITVNGIRVGLGSSNDTTNSVFGRNAFTKNITGTDNVAIGDSALNSNSTGPYNIAIGSSTLQKNDSGGYNSAVGHYALKNNTFGWANTAIGSTTLMKNTTGTANIAVGSGALELNTIGNANTGVGLDALHSNTEASDNTAFGAGALYSNNGTGTYIATPSISWQNGTGNTAVGSWSLQKNTVGSFNTALGAYTLSNIISSINTVAVGVGVLQKVEDQGDNTGIGAYSLQNSKVWGSTAVGTHSLRANTTGNGNTAIGTYSIYQNTTGNNNTGLGNYILSNNTTGNNNTAIGNQTLKNNTTSSNNTGIGYQSILNNNVGYSNTAVGAYTLYANTTGSRNTAIGDSALLTGNNYTNATAIGYNAQVTASNQIQLGNTSVTDVKTSGAITAAGFKVPNGTSAQYLRADGTVTTSVTAGVPYTGASQAVDLGAYNLKVNGISVGTGTGTGILGTPAENTNTVIGNNAYINNTSGSLTTAVGYYALNANTTGNWNDAFGSSSLSRNTTGSYNSAFGSWSMRYNTTGSGNNAFGRNSLRLNTTGSNNSAFGRNAMISNTTGSENTALGIYSLSSNSIGNENTALGNSALSYNVANSASVAIGHNAMKYADDRSSGGIVTGSTAVGYASLQGSEVASNNTGLNNTAVGYKSISNINTGSNNTAIGYNTMINNSDFNNSTAIGANAEVTQSNQIKLGDDNITDVTTSGIISSGKGFLARGIVASQRDAIVNPIAGLIIYCSDCGANGEIQFYNGVTWRNINGTNVAAPTSNSISLSSAIGTDKQTASLNSPITNIKYATALATGASVTSLPNGVTSSWSSNILTISGTPSSLGTYTYLVTLTGGTGTITKTGLINVVSLNATLSSASGTNSQTLCEGGTISTITYATTGVSSVTFYGLPYGVTGSFANNVATISGISYSPGKYNYTANFTDGVNSKLIKGVINTNSSNSFEMSSGSSIQSIVLTNSLTPILYKTTGATGVSVSGLPTGVNYAWSNNTLTISGTPTSVGFSKYILNSTGGCPISSDPGSLILAHRNCAYTNMAGSYKVIKDDLGDWNVNDVVTISAGTISNTLDLSNVYPNRQYGTVVNPLIINIDPTTGAASLNGPIQIARYNSSSVITANSVTGNLYACDGLIYLTFDFGTYGLVKLALQKL